MPAPHRVALVYGLRLAPRDAVKSLQHGTAILKDGRTREVTLHLLDGTREQVREQLLRSIDAFFELFAEEEGEVEPP